MPSYSCFFCPSKDRSDKLLTDKCPNCGRQYDFSLTEYPPEIDGIEVVEALDRGFYSAAYLCKRGALKHACVLKVVPTALYDFHGKDFAAECRAHAEVCADTEHVQKIEDYFSCNIKFGGEELPCHVAILEYVKGETLNKFLQEQKDLKGGVVALLAMDLIDIDREFNSRNIYHNDLHDRNIIIQELPAGVFRAEIPGVNVRAKAIDLGSLSDKSRSQGCGLRLGDQHQLPAHLSSMAKIIRKSYLDADVRVAETIDAIAALFASPTLAQRLPDHYQAKEDIKRAMFSSSEYPWTVPLRLAQFQDHYNAQTLDPWYVPLLLVDPKGRWVECISSSGPLVITGMRGCGKTMVLRALQLHARACWKPDESKEDALRRLREDRYVGLYLSCVRLLVKPGRHLSTVKGALERLFLAYGIEAIRAARHISSLDSGIVNPDYALKILQAINDAIDIPIKPIQDRSEDIERALLRASFEVDDSSVIRRLTRNPALAFDALAEAMRSSCSLWNSHRILFLLDDVSTRYLKPKVATELFSALLFQSPSCAFKMTTEAQTWLAVLRSPGLIEKARPGRDFDTFDLGAEVYECTRGNVRKDGKWFLEEILLKRIPYYRNHPKNLRPVVLLGDVSLEQIGRDIAAVQPKKTTRRTNKTYRGLSALAAVCVGDIGEVISIYDLMLNKFQPGKVPISDKDQAESYQKYCSHRLFELNRQKGEYKDFALGFAQASHDLLIRSAQKPSRGGRLRQYSKVYVRFTTGDMDKQFRKLRELIDAGIFVFNGGGPRKKGASADPTYNFALAYRKLYGLTSLMGLADSDRFEISGEALEDWLNNPNKTKDILMNNLGGPLEAPPAQAIADEMLPSDSMNSALLEAQMRLFAETAKRDESLRQPGKILTLPERWLVEPLELTKITDPSIRQIVLGLGFEERTLESARRILQQLRPSRAVLVKYHDPGKTEEILSLIKETGAEIEEIPYERVLQKGINLHKCNTLVDVTGLAKPALFSAIYSALKECGQVWLSHTKAQKYYPAEDDILRVRKEFKDADQHDLLDELGKLFTGEQEPYEILSVHSTHTDESRRRALCTFASAKHQRVLWLLNAREYDHIDMAIPPLNSERSFLARVGAEIAVWNSPSAEQFQVDPDDINQSLQFLLRRYSHWFMNGGYNFEIGLTGSKLQGCAAAIWTALYGATQCLYVQPAKFDHNRFTTGVGASMYYRVCDKERMQSGPEE